MLSMMPNNNGDYEGVSPYSDYILRTSGKSNTELARLTWYQLQSKYELIDNPTYGWRENKNEDIVSESVSDPDLSSRKRACISRDAVKDDSPNAGFVLAETEDAEISEMNIEDITDDHSAQRIDDAQIEGDMDIDEAKVDNPVLSHNAGIILTLSYCYHNLKSMI
jgi:hypothetical protein